MTDKELLQCINRKVTQINTLLERQIVPLVEKHERTLHGNNGDVGLVARVVGVERDSSRLSWWVKSIVMALITALIGVGIVTLMPGCDKKPPVPSHRDPIKLTSDGDPTDGAPPPTSAESATDLKIKLVNAEAKINVLLGKAQTSDKAVGVLAKVSWFCFIAAFIAYFIGGWPAAIRWGLAGLAVVFAPMIVQELWAELLPTVRWLAPICGIGFILWQGGVLYRRWLDRRAAKQQASNIRTRVETDRHLYSDKARAVLLGQAALLDHVSTPKYDPSVVQLPKVVHE